MRTNTSITTRYIYCRSSAEEYTRCLLQNQLLFTCYIGLWGVGGGWGVDFRRLRSTDSGRGRRRWIPILFRWSRTVEIYGWGHYHILTVNDYYSFLDKSELRMSDRWGRSNQTAPRSPSSVEAFYSTCCAFSSRWKQMPEFTNRRIISQRATELIITHLFHNSTLYMSGADVLRFSRLRFIATYSHGVGISYVGPMATWRLCRRER